MSEVSDACQIILVTGKGIYYLGEITVWAAMRVAKVMNTIYLSKWKGVTSLNRFRQIKGDEFMFVNISSEDKVTLSGIYNEMEAHGILLAQLPDLCGGDGRTQIVMSPSDAAKFKAFLLDHSAGKYKDIKVGQISAEDYARTGYDSRNKETPELAELTDSAKESLEQQKQLEERRSAGLLTNLGERLGLLQRTSDQEPMSDQQRNIGFFQPTSPAVRYFLERHDEEVRHDTSVTWISDQPLKSHEKWGLYEMPDGVHAVVIPNKDRYEFSNPEGVVQCRAALRDDEQYNLVNLATGDMKLVSGSFISGELERTDIRTENAELKNLRKNMGIPAESADKNQKVEILEDQGMGIRESPELKIPKDQKAGTYEVQGAEDLGKNITESRFPVFSISLKDNLDSGLMELPCEYRIPDRTKPEGYDRVRFSRSDCERLPDSRFMRIHIPADRSDTGEEEILTINRSASMEDGSLRFVDPGSRGVVLDIPGETEEDPDLLVHFNRFDTPDFTIDKDGQTARLSIDPDKKYDVSYVGPGDFNRESELSGRDIISQYTIASDRHEQKDIPAPAPSKSEMPVRNAKTETAGVPSGR